RGRVLGVEHIGWRVPRLLEDLVGERRLVVRAHTHVDVRLLFERLDQFRRRLFVLSVVQRDRLARETTDVRTAGRGLRRARGGGVLTAAAREREQREQQQRECEQRRAAVAHWQSDLWSRDWESQNLAQVRVP